MVTEFPALVCAAPHSGRDLAVSDLAVWTGLIRSSKRGRRSYTGFVGDAAAALTAATSASETDRSRAGPNPLLTKTSPLSRYRRYADACRVDARGLDR